MKCDAKKDVYEKRNRVKSGKEYRQAMMDKMNIESGEPETYPAEDTPERKDCMDRVDEAREERQHRIETGR